MTPQAPAGQFVVGVQQAFWKQTSPLAQHVSEQHRLLTHEALQQPLQTPSQQLGVLPPQSVSSQQRLQTPSQLTAVSAGQAQAPSVQDEPPSQLPTRGAPHGSPIPMRTGFFFFFLPLPLPRLLASAPTWPPLAMGDPRSSSAPSEAFC